MIAADGVKVGVAGVLAIALGVLASDDGRRARLPFPTCESPAPLTEREPYHQPGYIVFLHDGVDHRREAGRLERHYDFWSPYVWEESPGFQANVDLYTVQALRCEPTVKVIYPLQGMFTIDT